MGQDWKTLVTVVLGAAVLGWFGMRFFVGNPESPAPVEVPVAVPPAATPGTADDEAAAPSAMPVTPRPTASPANATTSTGGDPEAVGRDLEALAQALVRDQRIEDRVLPRVNDGLDVPGVTTYRRAPDFWEPALAGSKGMDR